MKRALISLLIVAGLFTLLNGSPLTKRVQKAKASPAKAPAKTNAAQSEPKIRTLKPADFPKFKDSAKGQVLVLNFWATLCGPCVAEFPELVAIDAKYRDKGVKFVGITSDDPEDVKPKVIPFIKKHQVKFDIVQQTPAVVGDEWSDYLPDSKDLISDWRKPMSCGNFNVATGKCGGKGS